MNPNICNNNDQTSSGVFLSGVAVPGAAGVVHGAGVAGAGVAGAGNGNIPIVPGVGVVAGSGSGDVAGDASAPGGSRGAPVVGGGDAADSVAGDVHGVGVVAASARDDVGLPGVLGVPAAPAGVHGVSYHGIPAVGGGDVAGRSVVGGVPAVGGGDVVGRSVAASTGGVVLEAGLVPPPVLVPNFPNNAPGLVPVAANFPNNAPPPAGAPGVGVPVAAIVSVPASAVFQSGHANPPQEGHHVFQIPYFDLCYSSGDEERNASNAPVVRNIKIKVEPGTQQLATEGCPLSHG